MSILLMFLFIIPIANDIDHVYIRHDGEVIGTIQRDEYMLDDLFIDEKKLDHFIQHLKEHIYKSPQNAMMNDRHEIIKEKPGIQLDGIRTKRMLYNFFYEDGPTYIDLPTEKVFPQVDSELLSQISVKELGSFTTYFNEIHEERAHNIRLSADAINNYVLFPGERFSFNDVVGERTTERGYKRAPVIVQGELTEDVGGGICQVSSTLFNAVNLKGVQIIERYTHSRRVPYVPPGKDAAVSWWGPDFVFKNKYNQPILIRTISRHGKITVTIYSSEDVKSSYH